MKSEMHSDIGPTFMMEKVRLNEEGREKARQSWVTEEPFIYNLTLGSVSEATGQFFHLGCILFYNL